MVSSNGTSWGLWLQCNQNCSQLAVETGDEGKLHLRFHGADELQDIYA